MFRFSHQTAKVYLDDELVYSLQVADTLSMVRTTGVNWAMIPLYREDAGKEVHVVLSPVYQNYQAQEIEFLLGSNLAIYTTQLVRALPEILLSLLAVLAGLVLFCIAVYFSIIQAEDMGFYALALLSASLGLWNFTQTDFAPLLLREKTVFLYYVSLTMLMICAIPLIKSVKILGSARSSQLLADWCVACGAVCIAQLALQLLGIMDLRELLKVTHSMIVISSLVLIVNSLFAWHGRSAHTGQARSHVWLLGVGALLDMINYYRKNSSSALLFVLAAILCYVILESIQLFASYHRQQQMLEEKETQLTLSRITAMMSQIRSHFVFNILNTISGMCKYDPEKADETVVRFARYLRSNIGIMEDDRPVLFSVELAHLEDYVVLEQIRFGDKIAFDVDVQTDQFLIPPLILQPVVENAIKHGLRKKPAGGTVFLRTWEESDCVKISVEDDGVGFELCELEKEASIGLKNIRYRLTHLMNGTLDITSEVGKGTTVTITLPKKESHPCT